MATDPLVGTYKRYKTGTEKLVKWLTESARLCQPIEVKTGVGPPTSKSSKKATCANLLAYAQRITTSTEPLIDIPIDIINVAKDAISGRKHCADWYAALATGLAATSVRAQSNARHRKFLCVLESIFDALKKEHKARRPKRKKKLPELAADTEDLSNLYLHLNLEEPSPASEDVQPQTSARRTLKTEERRLEKAPVYELEDEREEKTFAIWCLFKDFFDMRMQVRRMWEQYMSGELSFLVASKVTEFAINMMKQAAVGFAQQHPELDNFEKMMKLIGFETYVAEAITAGAHSYLEYASGMKPAIPTGTDKPDLLCMQAWVALENFRNHLPYAFTRDGEASEGKKKPYSTLPGHPFGQVMISIAEDLKGLAPQLSMGPDSMYNLNAGLDGYTVQLLFSMSDRVHRTSLIAATQMYFEIFDILGSELSRGIHESSRIVRHIDAAADRILPCLDHLSQFASGHMEPSVVQHLVMQVHDIVAIT